MTKFSALQALIDAAQEQQGETPQVQAAKRELALAESLKWAASGLGVVLMSLALSPAPKTPTPDQKDPPP